MSQKANKKDRSLIKINGNLRGKGTTNNTSTISQTPSQSSLNIKRHDTASGSKIPLFVAQSKSSTNIAGLGEELPEAVRREHQQHLAGRHTQTTRRSVIMEDLIIATNSLTVSGSAEFTSHVPTTTKTHRASSGFARHNRVPHHYGGINVGLTSKQSVFQNGSSVQHENSNFFKLSNEPVLDTDQQSKSSHQIINNFLRNQANAFLDSGVSNETNNETSDQNWRIRNVQNGQGKRKKFRRRQLKQNPDASKTHSAILNGSQSSGFANPTFDPSCYSNVSHPTYPTKESNPPFFKDTPPPFRGQNQAKNNQSNDAFQIAPEINGHKKSHKAAVNQSNSVTKRSDQQQNNANSQTKKYDAERNNAQKRNAPRINPEIPDNKQKFTEYLPLCELQEGLKKGEVVEGILRINPKNARDSYISALEDELDILISNYNDRNRALSGDKVVIKFHSKDKWKVQYSILNAKWIEFKDAFQVVLIGKSVEQLNIKALKLDTSELKRISNAINGQTQLKEAIENEFPNIPPEILGLSVDELCTVDGWKHFVRRTGYVVGITEYNHSRITGGTLQAIKTSAFYKCCSVDRKIPDIYVPKSKLPANFATTHNPNQLFLVKIVEWNAKCYFPTGEIFDDLGFRGEIEAELQIILKSNEIETSEFPDNILDGTGFEAVDWKIPKDELEKRRDFRRHCLFTIDPSTAKDLDDAISLKDLGEGRYEVGVHIADVSYFIREDTLLDKIASRRATSVYLPDRVIPMLPHQFCQNLCSLNPGEDKLAFSTVFVMNEEGIIESQWIGRTVINSCSKLSYENAQKLIDGDDIDLEEFPKIYNKWNVGHLRKSVVFLNKIAKSIRKKRFQTGSVRIDKSKLAFVLDDNQYPIGFAKYVFYDSNRLIEELMLLSNRIIAQHVYNRFSQEGRAFMRKHPPPDQNVLGKFKQYCAVLGLGFDTSSSLNIHKSLESVEKKSNELFRWISFQLIRSMKLAQYTTVSNQDSTLFFKHYALNFEYYTHFTSPIRRYADLIVHRLLSQDFGYDGACTKSSEVLRDYALNCNKQKQNAFMVSEDSSKVFMKAHIQKLGTMLTTGIVCEVFEKSLEVLLIDFDIPVRIYIDKMPIENVYYSKENGFANLKIFWQKSENNQESLSQNVTVTSIVPVMLSINEKFELHAVIPRPEQSSSQQTNADFPSLDVNL